MIGLSAPIPAADMPRVGGYPYTIICNYYPEWKVPGNAWNPDPWAHGTMAEHTERHPLIGGPVNQDTQEIMDAEIIAASSYGVDVFDFDWWWANSSNAEGGYNSYAISRFKQSTNAHLMKFCARPVVNGWTGTQASFRSLLQTLKLNFDHPSYYRIDGKPVVFWFALDHVFDRFVTTGIYANFEISSTQTIAEIRSQLGPCFICSISHPKSSLVGAGAQTERVGFDAVSNWAQIQAWSQGVPSYNWSVLPGQAADYVAATVETQLAATWIYGTSGTNIPYIPMLMCGRDGTPWADGVTLWGSTPAQWENHCAAMRRVMDKWPAKSLRILNIYSWNEYGEGGILAPRISNGYAYLEAMRRAFKPQLI